MKENKKTYFYIGLAFLVLLAVSVYRQISLKVSPDDALRPYIVYPVYMLLMGGWLYSVKARITQSFMARNLRLACYVMMFWLLIRFLQEAFFYRNTHIMRVSGYFTVFPLIVTTLFDLYAAFGLGRGEDYSIPKVWYLLMIPDLALVLLELTNEYHHIVFKVLPDEKENLKFHTNYGFVLILACCGILILSRIYMIYRKTAQVKAKKGIKLLPFLIGIAIPVVILPYLIKDFANSKEIIDLTAKLYFLEIMSWESCIILGLVPVNTQYGMVFERSTVGMRITDMQGKTRIKSSHARELSASELDELMSKGSITDSEGVELHVHGISDGYLIYQKDVSKMNKLIGELGTISSELKQENTLLAGELKSRSERAKVLEKTRIYDGISSEIGEKLSLIEGLIGRAADEKRDELLKRLCILGTYVKRRCNLRLIEQENGSIGMEELRLSLEDTVRCLNTVGIKAELLWEPTEDYSSQYCLDVFDSIENEIEECAFEPAELIVSVRERAGITVRRSDGDSLREIRIDENGVSG